MEHKYVARLVSLPDDWKQFICLIWFVESRRRTFVGVCYSQGRDERDRKWTLETALSHTFADTQEFVTGQ